MKQTTKSITSKAARTERGGVSKGTGQNRKPEPPARYGEVMPGHPFYWDHHKVIDRGTVLKRGEIGKTATWTGLGGNYVIARVSENDGGGYVVVAMITLKWDLNYGLFVSRRANTHVAHFPSRSECTSWIKRRAMSKDKVLA